MSEILKPCPFCRTKYNLTLGIERDDNTNTIIAYVMCLDCGTRGHIATSQSQAIDEWNKRDFSPIHGQWILYEDEDTNAWECSVCHKVQQLMNGTPFENNWHYCPLCGAKMEQESKR